MVCNLILREVANVMCETAQPIIILACNLYMNQSLVTFDSDWLELNCAIAGSDLHECKQVSRKHNQVNNRLKQRFPSSDTYGTHNIIPESS